MPGDEVGIPYPLSGTPWDCCCASTSGGCLNGSEHQRGLVRCGLLAVHLAPGSQQSLRSETGNLIYKYLPLLIDFDPLSRDGSKRSQSRKLSGLSQREVGGKNDRGTKVFKKGGRTFSRELYAQLIHGAQ